MNQAYYTGIIGTQTHQYGIDVVTDNIANLNTTGFRGSQVEFASLFENAFQSTNEASPTSDTIGYGSKVQATSMMENNGTFFGTDITTNLAIEGEGWFGIASVEGKLYTRAGNFNFDASRDLVTPDGSYVLGTLGNNISNSVLTSVLDTVPLGAADKQVALNLPEQLTYPVDPTTQVTFDGNLGIEDIQRRPGATVIDSTGAQNTLELNFTQTVPQPTSGTSWDVTATVTDPDGTVTYDTQTGTVLFDKFGALISNTLPTVDNNGTTVTIDLGSNYSGLVSIDNDDAGSFSSMADGYEGGELVGYDINQNADIIATFTNGRQSAVGKIAVYHFQNDQGLERVSGTMFRESSNSGDPIFYTDNDGNYILGSTVVNNMLENSNIRLEVSLTELIVLQRAFDANAKSITTGDELIQQALQMDA